ncbi:MAG: ABC transporter substrate-binding protein [Bacteroidetes bacterium]|nr:ABC transporter substrate-binding protein [Bacteroidota bacterium]
MKDKKDEASKLVFRYNESEQINSLDPAFANSRANCWVVNQLYNGLVKVNEKLAVVPSIAKSWKISPDGLEYTFVLRNDVYFHDDVLFLNNKGRKVRASDFVNSFKRILNKNTASPGAWIFDCIDHSVKSNFKGFMDVNDSTLKIYLRHPFPPFLKTLTMQYAAVVPIEIVEYYGSAFGNHPIGTGPFQLKSWEVGKRLLLARNANYFETEAGKTLPYLDAVSISFIKDKQTEYLEFMKGNLDFISGLEAQYLRDVVNTDGSLSKKCKGKINFNTCPALKKQYLCFRFGTNEQRFASNPFSNKLLRKAINYGIDKRKLLVNLHNNIGMAGNKGLLPIGFAEYDTSRQVGYPYNPEMAVDLLERAGYSEKNPCPTLTLNSTREYSDWCEGIKNDLIKIGINLQLNYLETDIYPEMLRQSAFTFYSNNWQADYPDAENCLKLFYSKNNSPMGENVAYYSNPNFDRLYEQSMEELNPEKRKKILMEMNQILIEDAALAPLYDEATVYFFQNTISGLSANPMNLLNLQTVKKAVSK